MHTAAHYRTHDKSSDRKVLKYICMYIYISTTSIMLLCPSAVWFLFYWDTHCKGSEAAATLSGKLGWRRLGRERGVWFKNNAYHLLRRNIPLEHWRRSLGGPIWAPDQVRNSSQSSRQIYSSNPLEAVLSQ